MPTLRDWEDYVDMEEQYDIEETRKKVQHKKKSHNKQEWDKLETKVKKVNPINIKKVHSNTLKSVGLSRQKIQYLKNLSDAFINNEIKHNLWNKMSDEDVIQDLIQIKGIGRWTAEMFLIFNLCRADIFPLNDIGMIKGLCKLYNLDYPINKDKLLKVSQKWKPYRSVATWYFWRSLDPIPVEY